MDDLTKACFAHGEKVYPSGSAGMRDIIEYAFRCGANWQRERDAEEVKRHARNYRANGKLLTGLELEELAESFDEPKDKT